MLAGSPGRLLVGMEGCCRPCRSSPSRGYLATAPHPATFPRACCLSSTPTLVLQSFMYQLLKGVAHMHKHGVMHRDLKPQNLLVDDSTQHPLLKVADLGLGRHFSIPIKAYTHEVGRARARVLVHMHCALRAMFCGRTTCASALPPRPPATSTTAPLASRRL